MTFFVKNCYTEFRDYQTGSLVTDTSRYPTNEPNPFKSASYERNRPGALRPFNLLNA
jgi:hypothetical protein